MRLETGYLKFEIGLRRLHRVGFGKLKVGSWIALLLGIATLAGNGEALLRLARNAVFLRNSWQARGYRSSGDYIDLPRQMVERHVAPDASVFFACIHSNQLLAVERSQHLAISWTMCPTPVPFGYDPAIGDADAVLACAYGPGPEFESAGLDPDAFEKIDEGGGRALWLRRDRARASPSAGRVDAPSPARELAGLAAPLLVATAGALTAGWGGALFGLLLFSIGMAIPPLADFRPSPLFVVAASALCIAGARGSRRWLRDAPATPGDDARRRRRAALAAGLLFAVLAGALALSHTFVGPNGSGVSGGRAKLLYLSSGVPDGFFTDPARSTLQPAYPPGFALLTLGCYGLAGGCGEWLKEPWRYAFAYPAAVIALAGLPSLRTPSLKAAGVAALVAFAAFAGIFALSAAPDFAWHLDSAERLLWIPALVLLRELAYAFCQSASRSPRATCLKTSGMPVSNAQRRPS